MLIYAREFKMGGIYPAKNPPAKTEGEWVWPLSVGFANPRKAEQDLAAMVPPQKVRPAQSSPRIKISADFFPLLSTMSDTEAKLLHHTAEGDFCTFQDSGWFFSCFW
jgi:hypothetical protein